MEVGGEGRLGVVHVDVRVGVRHLGHVVIRRWWGDRVGTVDATADGRNIQPQSGEHGQQRVVVLRGTEEISASSLQTECCYFGGEFIFG